MIGLIDTHSHLEEIEDLEVAMERAGRADIAGIITMASDLTSCKRALEISGDHGHTRVYAALGIHPWQLREDEIDETIRFIEGHLGEAVALGEIGLDFWLKQARKNPSHRDLQKKVFRSLLDLSGRHNKPAVIHARGAWEDALEIVLHAGIRKANFHWFSGPPEILTRALEAGYFISATPAAAYSKEHQAAIQRTPLERLLIETDSPVSYQNERAEPAHLLKTLKAVSLLKGVPEDDVARVTTENAVDFFGLDIQGGINGSSRVPSCISKIQALHGHILARNRRPARITRNAAPDNYPHFWKIVLTIFQKWGK